MEAQALVIGLTIQAQLHKAGSLRTGFFCFEICGTRKTRLDNPIEAWEAYNQPGRHQTTTLGALVFGWSKIPANVAPGCLERMLP
jgi:hypothetical protein